MRSKSLDNLFIKPAAFVFMCFFLLALTPQALAQSRPRETSVQALEYSLKSLYESAGEVAKKNSWLSSEIEKMEQELAFLKEEAQSLESKEVKKRISTVLDDREIMASIPWDEKRLNTMYEDHIELDEENVYLKDRLLGKQNDQKDIEASLKQLDQELKQLTQQREALEKRLDKRVDSFDLSRIESTYARSKKSLKYAQQKFKRMEKKHGRPYKQFTKLKDKNFSLKGKIAFLSSQLNNLEEEQAAVTEEIHQIKSMGSGKFGDINGEIARLKKEQKSLLTVVKKASDKLGSDFNIPDYEEEISRVRSNIDEIRSDNTELKKELNLLRRKIGDGPE